MLQRAAEKRGEINNKRAEEELVVHFQEGIEAFLVDNRQIRREIS